MDYQPSISRTPSTPSVQDESSNQSGVTLIENESGPAQQQPPTSSSDSHHNNKIGEVDAWGRIKGVTVVKPIVYGNTARYLQKKMDNGHTHAWTLFVKPYFNEDTTKWIRKVTFKLHDSYNNHLRVKDKPPYTVEETGWGEFEVIIKIYFVDSNEKPVQCFHIIKLFQNDPLCIAGKKNVVSEIYDEIVFQEPSSYLYGLLKSTEPKSGRQIKSGNETDFEEKKVATLQMLKAAREEVRGEIGQLRDALKDARSLLVKFTQKTKSLEESLPPHILSAITAPTPSANPPTSSQPSAAAIPMET